MTGAGLALGEARRLGELAPLGEFLIIVSISRCSCIPGRRAAGGAHGPRGECQGDSVGEVPRRFHWLAGLTPPSPPSPAAPPPPVPHACTDLAYGDDGGREVVGVFLHELIQQLLRSRTGRSRRGGLGGG